MQIRAARMGDVKAIQKLINHYARRGEMLPLSLQELYENLREFTVAEDGGVLAGACALHICWENLGEIRSLAVRPDFSGRGIGRRLVEHKLQEGRQLGIKRIFALTYRDSFFSALGFEPTDKEQLPHKVWADCVKCVKFPDCDENAYTYDLC